MKLSVLVTMEKGVWIAVGLEHFLVGQGSTPEAALADISQQIELKEILDRSHNQEPFALVPRAPDSYWEQFKTARWQSQAQSLPYEGELYIDPADFGVVLH